MENSDNLILINIKDYEKLVQNDIKYKTLIGTILNQKNIAMTEDSNCVYSVAGGLILNLVENLEPDKYAIAYAYLKRKKEKEKERIEKELEKVSEITKA